MHSPQRLADDYRPGGRPVTGRAVLMMMVAFFGVIFVANVVLVRLASSTFRGLEVESAYKAGQEFNAELAAVAAQRERAWAVEASVARRPDGRVGTVVEVRDAAGAPIGGLSGEARLAGPADATRDRSASLVETTIGRYEAAIEDAAPGRWDLVTSLSRDGEELFRSRNRILVD